MKIDIKHRYTGEVLFSHEQENNSIKVTVELAFEKNINLRYADLRSADLSSAGLSSANLSYADLSSANLSYADLSSANLSSADLSSADLRSADLRSANLSSANLSSANLSSADLSSANLSYADLSSADLLCKGDMKFIFTLQIDEWPIGFTKEILQIGCQTHPITEWREFTDDQISKMSKKALDWWKRWKQPLFAIIDERLKDAE